MEQEEIKKRRRELEQELKKIYREAVKWEETEGNRKKILQKAIEIISDLLELEKKCKSPVHENFWVGICPDCGKRIERRKRRKL
jgi:hypothetical protein